MTEAIWKKFMAVTLVLTMVISLMPAMTLPASAAEDEPAIIYVNEIAIGSADGSSWDNAYTTLQAALDKVKSGDHIWVAKGTYYPTSANGIGEESDVDYDRYKHFQMKNGVKIYGGFAGDEAEDYDLSARDFTVNETILSGDIGTQGDNSDNSYHVFFHYSMSLDSTAELDGFTISGGNANGEEPYGSGAGMYNGNSSPTLTNVIFSGNSANRNGGGMYNNNSSPILTNVTFSGNRADVTFYGSGGGMYNGNSSPVLTNVTFSGNSAGESGEGGGMNNYNSSPTLTDVEFSGNSTGENGIGGGMYNYNSSPTLTDVNFGGNSAFTGGGMQNDDSSPTLTDVTFRENSAKDEGGGMYNWKSNPALTDVTFIENRASYSGGMSNNYSSPTLTDVIFIGNSANYAGGMYNFGSSPELINVAFSGNSAQYNGGGMNSVANSSPVLTNVIFSGNSANYGGGMYNDGGSVIMPVLTNTTFSGNSAVTGGGGMYNQDGSNLTIKNSIFWSNLNGQIDGPGTADITYSLIQDYTGTGDSNINCDPIFTGASDFSLNAGSPAIDTGTNEPFEAGGAAYGVTTDLVGNPRIANNIVDMGAYENQNSIVVKAQPDKLVYTEGETLDLTGLEVTLTYNDGSTADIGWADFDVNGITADPADKTVMTATAYNGQPVTLTWSSLTTETANLTVNAIPAPGAPTGVTATGGNAKITLSWNSAAGATGYKIYQSEASGSYVTVLTTVAGSVYSYEATGLTNGVPYYFVIKSTNAGGDSPYSDEVSATPHRPSNSDSDRDNTPSTPSAPPANTGVDIFVNGKAETAAAATTIREGDKTVTSIVVDAKKVEERLAQEGNNAVVTIPVKNGSDVVIGTLNGQTVKNMENMEAVLEIKTENVIYTIPASQINIDAVSARIGEQIELKDIAVSVKISEPAADTVKIVEDTANENNYQIIVKPIEFAITCSSGSKTIEVSKFNAYVERLVAIPEGIDPSKITTGIILNADGSFSHVPTVITIIDGKYYAKINSLTNSVYSVIYSPKTFKDVEKHWAKESVNDMASRLVVSGVGEDKFEPDRDITRAEFAAITVRALGLMRPGTGQDTFDDVAKNAWYYDAVSIAYEYGLIAGYGNGRFGPMDKITREQAMTMVARAMRITGLEAGKTDSEVNKVLAGFTDANSAADYAKAGIAACVKTEIVSGRSKTTLAPKDNITRAEVAVIVRRLLQQSGLI